MFASAMLQGWVHQQDLSGPCKGWEERRVAGRDLQHQKLDALRNTATGIQHFTSICHNIGENESNSFFSGKNY